MTVVEMATGHAHRPIACSAEKLLVGLYGTTRFNLIDSRTGGRYALLVGEGDFLRIPPLTIHWASAGDEAGAWVEAQTPASTPAGDTPLPIKLLTDRESESHGLSTAYEYVVDRRRYDISGTEQLEPFSVSLPTRWFVASTDVPEYAIDRGYTVPISTRFVYGSGCSLMIATRPSGYHSTPHIHAPEQLNFVAAGEIDGFILDEDGEGLAFPLTEGDFWRVPPTMNHWAWNRAKDSVTLIECHSPGMEGDPVLAQMGVGLVDSLETEPDYTKPVNLFVEVDQTLIDRVEAFSEARSQSSER